MVFQESYSAEILQRNDVQPIDDDAEQGVSSRAFDGYEQRAENQ